ncbi:TPA: hypothetical protein PIT84_004176 [Klebsiella quasipneumoniae subsp. similipneumoniae]|uniref:hypothetical protein n=1 Tax=Klebsiella sp. RC2 TaxID=2587038 RepID=UPI00160C7DF8|nr:hypothetical protein [Klebsiella sp. RC2]MBB3333908.1 hypothetical protein [Klebsiella sp. RC2]HDH1416604.1 hypothetical protein [Klebsiella quasipneumoniae subsp. similipneumoniae]
MSDENKRQNKQQREIPTQTGRDQKTNNISPASEPIKWDSTIPVPGSKVVTESYQPPVSKKSK